MPPQGPHPQLPQLRVGVKDGACERRSLLTGISHGEPSRGEKSGPRTILGPARTGLLATDGPRPGALSSELPGAEQLGERCTDEPSAKSVPQHPAPVELEESEGLFTLRLTPGYRRSKHRF